MVTKQSRAALASRATNHDHFQPDRGVHAICATKEAPLGVYCVTAQTGAHETHRIKLCEIRSKIGLLSARHARVLYWHDRSDFLDTEGSRHSVPTRTGRRTADVDQRV